MLIFFFFLYFPVNCELAFDLRDTNIIMFIFYSLLPSFEVLCIYIYIYIYVPQKSLELNFQFKQCKCLVLTTTK